MSGWRQARASPILAAAAVAGNAPSGPVAAVDAWIRQVIAQHHPTLGRVICPFVPPALERGHLYYAPVSDCRCPEDVVFVMDELVDRFGALPPVHGRDAQLKTLVAIFVDVDARDAERVVIAAHPELKDRCTERGLMVGEFAPGYQLASTRNPDVDVGDAPAPVLALRQMVPSDRRFLLAEDRWIAAWATRFGAHRVPLFRTFSTKELAAIGRVASEVQVEAGRVLCEQGDEGNEFFLIIDGEASVHRNGNLIAALGPGQYFGELALLTLRPRNATVTAITDMTLLVLGRREFRGVIDAVPSVTHMLLTGLAERLNEADTESVHH
jgi:CRP/FNR family cyclic AMP-dependent transcriptional regulator